MPRRGKEQEQKKRIPGSCEATSRGSVFAKNRQAPGAGRFEKEDHCCFKIWRNFYVIISQVRVLKYIQNGEMIEGILTMFF